MATATPSPFQTWFPGTSSPLICNAPMYGFADARLATAVAQAGGLGFIGGGFDFRLGSSQIPVLAAELSLARTLLSLPSSSTLPIGVGFLTFNPVNFVEGVIPVLLEHKPIAVWLFAPTFRDQHAEIIAALKAAGKVWGLKVFVQIGSVQTARDAVEDGCDILICREQMLAAIRVRRVQYKDSGISIIAARGVIDGRGITTTLALGIYNPVTEVLILADNVQGAEGVAMGTRFVVTEECPSSTGTKSIMISTADGGNSTIKYYNFPRYYVKTHITSLLLRSTIHDTIQGTLELWPVQYDGRGIINDSHKDLIAGNSKEEVMQKYKAAKGCDDATRNVIWAGTGVGLIKSILTAREVLSNSRDGARKRVEVIQQFVDYKLAGL